MRRSRAPATLVLKLISLSLPLPPHSNSPSSPPATPYASSPSSPLQHARQQRHAVPRMIRIRQFLRIVNPRYLRFGGGRAKAPTCGAMLAFHSYTGASCSPFSSVSRAPVEDGELTLDLLVSQRDRPASQRSTHSNQHPHMTVRTRRSLTRPLLRALAGSLRVGSGGRWRSCDEEERGRARQQQEVHRSMIVLSTFRALADEERPRARVPCAAARACVGHETVATGSTTAALLARPRSFLPSLLQQVCSASSGLCAAALVVGGAADDRSRLPLLSTPRSTSRPLLSLSLALSTRRRSRKTHRRYSWLERDEESTREGTTGESDLGRSRVRALEERQRR